MSMQLIQAEIFGYAGNPVNLLAVFHAATGKLIVAKELKLGEREPGALVTTNNPRGERDRLFHEDLLENGIKLYYSAVATKSLEILATLSKHSPGNRMQVKAMSDTGTRYELSPDTTNGNIAVVAILDAANVTSHAAAVNEMGNELADMFISI